LSTRKSAWARAFYDQQKEDGKSHHAAVRALTFKWQRIIFRCWKDRCPYDESRYLAACAKRRSAEAVQAESPANKGSAVVHADSPGNKEKAVEIQWKNVGGFSKPDSISC
jgi:hypothetical protein